MEDLQKLKEIVENAITSFKNNMPQSNYNILSEGDFERLLTNKIECDLPEEYVIHNQVSYYGNNNSLQYRVDAVVMRKSDIINAESVHKGYTCNGLTVAIELKYYRRKDYVSSIRKDILKSVDFLNNKTNAFLYVVALLEDDKGKVAKIDKIKEEFSNNNFSVITII